MNTEIKEIPKLKTRTFELCFDKEPSPRDIQDFQNTAAVWQNHKVIKMYPTKCKTEKHKTFWTLTFEIDKNDVQFWCGFIAGKDWKIKNITRNEKYKLRDAQASEYFISI